MVRNLKGQRTRYREQLQQGRAELRNQRQGHSLWVDFDPGLGQPDLVSAGISSYGDQNLGSRKFLG